MANTVTEAEGRYSGWYDDAYAEFTSRGKYVENMVACFKHHLKGHNLASSQTCLSIGAGQGQMECNLLRDLMTQCTLYCAVEPEESNIAKLKHNLSALCPNVEAHITASRVEDWAGPPSGQKVDTIFLFHVLYYVKDVSGLLTKCLRDWLNPGGQVIVLLQEKCSCVLFAKQIGALEHEYIQDDFVKQLEGMGLFTNATVQCANYVLDLNDVNRDLANFYYMRQTTDEEVCVLSEFFKTTYPDGKENNREWITVITA